jgi:hypothetical protein
VVVGDDAGEGRARWRGRLDEQPSSAASAAVEPTAARNCRRDIPL